MLKKLMVMIAAIVAPAVIAGPLANAAESTPVTRSVVEVVLGSVPSARRRPNWTRHRSRPMPSTRPRPLVEPQHALGFRHRMGRREGQRHRSALALSPPPTVFNGVSVTRSRRDGSISCRCGWMSSWGN